ncbi:DUF4129 domain-containing protein, partial [Actinoplanes sp. NPDC026623]|uniref:DUF4129 domain-containing protein n=1 Tax=Actinoplanes sp. NPDC026623 TaxID=3155610 RepID=UPI0033F3847F
PPPRSAAGPPSRRRPWTLLLALPAAILLWPVAVPAIWAVRARRRRRGAVTNAEREVRDRLRAHGVTVTRAMTLRDLAEIVPRVATDLRRLGEVIDRAAWSGAEPSADDHRAAWSAVYGIRLGLADPALKARLRAVTTLRGL